MKDFYKVLGVRPNATLPQIKAAYRSLVRQYHPDYNPGSDVASAMTRMINEAYEILSDRRKRYAYDQIRTAQFQQDPQHDGESEDNIAELVSRKLQEQPPSAGWLKVVWWWLRDLASYRLTSIVVALIYAIIAHRFGNLSSLLTFLFVLVGFQSDVIGFILLWFLPEILFAWWHIRSW